MKTSLRLCTVAAVHLLILVFSAAAEPTYTTIFSYSFTGQPGANPDSKPLEGSDGALYGTTRRIYAAVANRPDGLGVIYRVNKEGSAYTILHQFEDANDGAPGALIETTQHELWGTTSGNRYGTIFKMKLDGSGFTTVQTLNSPPRGPLLESGGAMYGVTCGRNAIYGDHDDPGFIFKINKDGSGFTVLRAFSWNQPSSGWAPAGSLVEGYDGFLYGTTGHGGITDKGTIFRLRKDGTGFLTLYNFTGGQDGEIPHAGVIEGSDGRFYGTTGGLGFNGHGSVYKINKDGTGFTVLRSSDPDTGSCCDPQPRHGMVLEDLIEGSDGALYVSGLESAVSVVFKILKDGSGYTVLKGVPGGNAYTFPLGVIEGADGLLYGTTEGGGEGNTGTVFKMSKTGTDYAVVRAFDGGGNKGISPGGLVYGNDNMLYGSSAGGSNTSGALYRLNTNGSDFSVIYNFTGGADGALGGLLFHGSDGLLYGLSSGGILFRLNTEGGDFQVLHQFTNGGCSGLIEGPDGLLYGGTTSVWGPAGEGMRAEGISPTLFKMNKDGSGYETFYTYGPSVFTFNGVGFTFLSGSDGYIYGARNNMLELFRFQVEGVGFQTLVASGRQYGIPSLFAGSDGALYSVWPPDRDVCPSCNFSIARINKDGSDLRLIQQFVDEVAGFTWPRVLEGPDGLIYGSGTPDRPPGPGTIFRLAKDGTGYTNLFTYPMQSGAIAFPTFIKGGPSDFYGVTTAGGTDNLGTIYRLHVPVWAPILTGGSTWSSEVVLNWIADDPRTTGFVIFRKTGTIGKFTEIARVGGNVRAFHDTNLAPSTVYKYFVTATDGVEYSEYSNRAMVTTPAQEHFVTLISDAAGDGFVAEANKFANVGAMAFPSSAGPAAIRAGDTSLDQQVKGIVSFRTADLADNATVIYARLKLRRGIMYGNPFDALGACYVDIKNGTGFGTTPGLKAHDFQWPATKTRIGVLTPDSNSEWYYVQLEKKSLAYVDKTGYTQFRLCFERADNNDLAPDYIGWYSAEYPNAEYRPTLELIYR